MRGQYFLMHFAPRLPARLPILLVCLQTLCLNASGRPWSEQIPRASARVIFAEGNGPLEHDFGPHAGRVARKDSVIDPLLALFHAEPLAIRRRHRGNIFSIYGLSPRPCGDAGEFSPSFPKHAYANKGHGKLLYEILLCGDR